MRSEAPFIGTGLERKVAVDSGAVVTTKVSGKVTYVDGKKIIIEDADKKEHTYRLLNYSVHLSVICLSTKNLEMAPIPNAKIVCFSSIINIL